VVSGPDPWRWRNRRAPDTDLDDLDLLRPAPARHEALALPCREMHGNRIVTRPGCARVMAQPSAPVFWSSRLHPIEHDPLHGFRAEP